MTAPAINQFRERAERNRAARDSTRSRVLQLIGEHGRARSVEIAEWLGDGSARGVARAKSVLVRLQREGVLCSVLEPSPISGHGRRYYRLRGPA